MNTQISNLFVNQIVIIHYNKKKLKLNRHAFERSWINSYEWKMPVSWGVPAFCEYICPVGTLEGGIPLLSTHPELRRVIGTLFSVKMVILVITLVGCLSICRFFCKVMCPLGAIYGLLNKVSLFHMDVNMGKCIHCGKCTHVCPMDVDPVKTPDSAECIRCGKCVSACPKKALKLGMR